MFERAGLGWLVVWFACESFQLEVAEALAVLEGLKFAKDINWKKVAIESDAKAVSKI